MKRDDNWVSKLQSVIESAEDKDFCWEHHNCCTFTSDCVMAMTGIDPMNEFRGRFKTQRGAFNLLTKVSGGKTLIDSVNYFAAIYKLNKIPPSFAGRGDIVVVLVDSVQIMSIVDLSGRFALAICPSHGLVKVPVETAIRAWRLD